MLVSAWFLASRRSLAFRRPISRVAGVGMSKRNQWINDINNIKGNLVKWRQAWAVERGYVVVISNYALSAANCSTVISVA